MRNTLLKTLCALLLAAAAILSPALAEGWMDGYAHQVLSEVNAERAKYGLSPLRLDAQLSAAARVRAQEIVNKFSHIRPDGRTGSSASALARNENIARGHNSPGRVMAAWLTSPSHRRSILSPAYASTGIACLEVGGVCHWVQLFGR